MNELESFFNLNSKNAVAAPATVFIYGLNDPVTGKCRYVGKSIDLRHRMKDHIQKAKRGKTHRDRWISSLLLLGLAPQLEILDEVPASEWEFWEREYIRVFRMVGFNLTNLTEGGEGLSPGVRFSEEHKRKLGAARKGRKFSVEHKQKIGDAHRGRVWSDAQRLNVRLCKQITSEETRQKMRTAWVGRKLKYGNPNFRIGPNGQFQKHT